MERKIVSCRVKVTKIKQDGKYHAVKVMKKHGIIKLKQVDHINNEKRLMELGLRRVGAYVLYRLSIWVGAWRCSSGPPVQTGH